MRAITKIGIIIAVALTIWIICFTGEDDSAYLWIIPLTEFRHYGVVGYCLLIGFGMLFLFGYDENKTHPIVNKLIKVISISILYVGAFLFFLPFLILPVIIGLITVIKRTYSNYYPLFVLLVCLFTIVIVAYISIIVLIKFTQKYRFIASLRILFICSLLLLALLFLISVFDSFGITDNDYIVYGLMFITIILFVAGWLIFKEWYFIVYDKKQYLLYLRSFQFDKNEIEVAKYLKVTGLPVMKIGNPNTFFPKGAGDVFYLPTVNWKKQLNYYIDRAKYIFSVVDMTEGVLWEIFEHQEQTDKFIYYISNSKHLCELLKRLPKQRKTILMECLEVLSNTPSINNCAFYIRDDKCYYSDPETILKLVINHESKKDIKSFKITMLYREPYFNNRRNTKDYYKYIDCGRFFLRNSKCFIRSSGSILLSIVFTVIWFMSILFLIGAIICLFMPDSFYLWVGIEPWTTGERIECFLVALFMANLMRNKKYSQKIKNDGKETVTDITP